MNEGITFTVSNWIVAYFFVAGIAIAFLVGQALVKLLLLRFSSENRIDNVLWKLGELAEMKYGPINAALTIKAKRYTVTIKPTLKNDKKIWRCDET